MDNNYVDLDLPSGNLWSTENEEGFFSCKEAVNKFGRSLPTKEDFEELVNNTWHRWDDNKKGMWFCSIVDVNKKIFIPALGWKLEGIKISEDSGFYWSGTHNLGYYAFNLYFSHDRLNASDDSHYSNCLCVRTIKRK